MGHFTHLSNNSQKHWAPFVVSAFGNKIVKIHTLPLLAAFYPGDRDLYRLKSTLTEDASIRVFLPYQLFSEKNFEGFKRFFLYILILKISQCHLNLPKWI